MQTSRPVKTLADYLVITVSPVLIMVLVGSLVFFLIQVFYRGEMQGGLRWVMFWFVLAIVLVARIGIEHGPGYGSLYGLALAAATWLHLAMNYPGFLLGIVLLSIVWWSANKLTWDCTLIDDDEDASGQGLLEVAVKKNLEEPPRDDPPFKRIGGFSRKYLGTRKNKTGENQAHTPGLWVVYFSLAALPLFGVGHVLIPASELAQRQRGFIYLCSYLAAALGLLLTTNFLGLRRYLRQRHLPMPATIALGWIQSGVGVAVIVMALTLLVPRPGADYTWKTLAVQVDHYIRTVSQYATPPNPPGKGQKEDGSEKTSTEGTVNSRNSGTDQGNQPMQEETQSQNSEGSSASKMNPPPAVPPGAIYVLLKRLVLLSAILWLSWWLFRERHLIFQVLQALWQAILQFFRDLLDLSLRPVITRKTGVKEKQTPKPKLFAAYKNPFVTHKERVWPPEQVIAYSFEAIQAWAREQGWEPRQDQTPREICTSMEVQFPEHSAGLRNLAHLYGYAAYGRQLPANTDWEPLRQLWRNLTEPNAIIR